MNRMEYGNRQAAKAVPRSQRRLLVVASGLAFLAFAGSLIAYALSGGIGEGSPVIWFVTYPALVVHIVLTLVLTSGRLGLSDGVGRIDERQQQIRARAYRTAHQINMALLGAAGIYVWGAYGGSWPRLPDHYLVWALPIYGVFVLAQMPMLVLAWTEPDALHDPL